MMPVNRREFLQSAGAIAVYFALPGCEQEISVPAEGSAAFANRILLDTAGNVQLNLGKVELGQGIGTALAQIAAEELCVDFSRVSLAGVDTDYSPDESYTFSTISIQQSGPRVRQAAAAGRKFLMERASLTLGISVTDLKVADGNFVVNGKPANLDYWQLLAGEHIEVSMDDEAPLVLVAQHRLVGESLQRLDIPAKVFGEASFLQDMRLPGMLHARVVRPPAERARLTDFHPGSAEKMSGVVKVVRDGDFVAVIAEREGQAREAANTIRKTIDWSLAGDLPEADHVHDWLKTAPNRVESVASRQSAAEIPETNRVGATYQRPYQAHASISPSAAIALYENEKLTIWSHAQGMYPLRTAIAHTFGLEPEQVRCVHKEAAGCYGHNGADDAACDAAALAMQMPGRPIRMQWERADEFAWEPYGSAMQIEVTAGLDPAGRIRDWNYDLWSCPHTSRPRSAENAGHFIYAQHRSDPLDIPAAASIPQPNGGSDRNAVPLYSFDNLNVTKHLITQVPLRVSSLRGLGAYANVFAIESFMDELAQIAGQDPISFRKQHLDDPRAIALLDRLAEASGWADRPEPGSGEGWGVGFARFKNLSSYVGIVFQVSTNNQTGNIELKRATAVCDAGLVVNPDGVRAQIEGGIVQSASWTLKEQVQFTDSRIESRDWASYPILRFDEVPDIEVVLMPHNNEKAVGVGEAAQGPAAAAIANAVFHASGRRLRNLPLTAERFLHSAA